MKKYLIKCVDYGWTATILTGKIYDRGDLCVARGCVCVILREV